MDYDGLPEIREQAKLWDHLEMLRQNQLMGESEFLRFVRDRGISVSGDVEGEPGEFVRRNWLQCDSRDNEGPPLFHPFRLFPIHRILDQCALRIATGASLRPESYLFSVSRWLGEIPSDEEFQKLGREWNRVVDLAVLLEPIYWPRIVGRQLMPPSLSEQEARRTFQSFRTQALEFVRSLDLQQWKRVHECLCFDAARLDKNSDLYVLLRVANWAQRKMLQGPLSGALWLRHMAELIRRGFEEVFEQRWSEEYVLTGPLDDGVRKRSFGAERPLDNSMRSKPFVARFFGLFTGSSVRWYV